MNNDGTAVYAFRKFGNTVLRAAFALSGSYAEAEDIVQDVFLSLHTQERTFNDDEHLKAWLLRVTINKCKNLRFLLDIFSATGHTPQTFGRLTHNPNSTSTSLRRQLHQDDMRVLKAKQVLTILGYQLEFEIKERTSLRQVDPRYKLVVPDDLRRNLERGYIEEKDRNKNLTFLLEFMARNNLSKYKLAQAVGLFPATVTQWFDTDDVSISYLFKIGEIYDAEIIFIVSKMPKQKVKANKIKLARHDGLPIPDSSELSL